MIMISLQKIRASLPTSALARHYCQGQVQEATFDFPNYKLHRLDEGPPTTTTLTRDQALKLYKEMVTIRRLETASANLYKEKAIRGFCHLCSGQEAVYSGIVSALRPQDTVITSYRAHGFTYALGVPVLGVLAELTGRKSGVVRGEGGAGGPRLRTDISLFFKAREAACTCTPGTFTVATGGDQAR